ncbi:MAG: Na/Pi symporter [Candidatus Latescibacteria bacterium]|nr:Na/Pi symporter [Candidatus Latescibacterota bacterium]
MLTLITAKRIILTALVLVVSIGWAQVNQTEIKLVRPFIGETDMSGDGQVGEVMSGLPKPLMVQVQNQQGVPVAEQEVRFSVLSEPSENVFTRKQAVLSDEIVKTDNSGYARVDLQVGGTVGEYRIIAQTCNESYIFSVTALHKRWYLMVIFGLAGGLCFFLFGLYYGSKGLRRMAGSSLREIVFNLTRRRILGVSIGMLITMIFQSSTATSVLLISFASTGLIGLSQALAVILGADVGTTFTAQILAFKLYDYALFIIIAGFLLMNAHKKVKDLGQAIFGFGLVFFAIKMVFETSAPLKYFPGFTETIVSFGNYPVLGIIISMIFTFLVHSSAATIGIAVGLAFSGLIGLQAAIPIILGANLGTSFSPLIASFKASIEARRVAIGHTLFKLLTVIILLPFLNVLTDLVSQTAAFLPRQIANAHTLINIFATALFLPFLKPYEKLLRRLIPERPADKLKIAPIYLDDTILDAPAMALAQAHREVLHMGDLVLDMFAKSLPVFINNDKEARKIVAMADDKVDSLEKNITAYLTKMSASELSPELSRRNVALFYVINDLEHIGDIISKSLMSYTKKKIDNNLMFSEQGLAEISEFHQQVYHGLRKAMAALSTWDKDLAQQVVDCREFGNVRLQELHNAHLQRLRAGLKESIDTSTIHLDFIADLERINFHCAKIGFAVLQALSQTPIVFNSKEIS